MNFLLPNYGTRIPLNFVGGRGAFLIEKSGEKFLDFLSGVAVSALGHSHPKILTAIDAAKNAPLHVSNYFKIESQKILAEKISKLAGGDFAGFFCNSGAEANEAALKLARKICGPKKKIFYCENSFHGRTFGALSVTGKISIQKNFEPLLPQCEKIKFNNFDDLQKIDENCGAIILELVQGEGGVQPAEKNWVQKLFARAEKFGAIKIIDEIQTGIGRTGKFFAFENFKILPDIFSLAKALGGGLPIGAMFAKKKFAENFSAGSHGSTFGGNPFVTRVARAVVDEISAPQFLKNVQKNSAYFLKNLQKIQQKFPEKILEIRGIGLLLGAKIADKNLAQKIYKKLRDEKILANVTAEKILRILPSLIATRENFDFFCEKLEKILKLEK